MPTISGLRRRGYTPESIRDFCARIGVAKKENVIDVAQLEHSVREDLNARAPRVMAVLRPLKVVHRRTIPRARSRRSTSSTTPKTRRPARARCRSRACSTSSATTSWRTRRRSSSGCRRAGKCGCAARTSSRARRSSRTTRGEIVELRCTYDPATRGGDAPDGRKVKATLHWVSARARRAGRSAALRSAVLGRGSGKRAEGKTFLDYLNPHSLEVLRGCQAEPSLGAARHRARASSSSGSDTSASIPIQPRKDWSSTAPSR